MRSPLVELDLARLGVDRLDARAASAARCPSRRRSPPRARTRRRARPRRAGSPSTAGGARTGGAARRRGARRGRRSPPRAASRRPWRRPARRRRSRRYRSYCDSYPSASIQRRVIRQRGSVKRNALPPPSAGSTQMRPPWPSMMRRHTASPIPAPSTCVVRAREHAEDPASPARDRRRRRCRAWSRPTPGCRAAPRPRPAAAHRRGTSRRSRAGSAAPGAAAVGRPGPAAARRPRRRPPRPAGAQILGHLGHQLAEHDRLACSARRPARRRARRRSGRALAPCSTRSCRSTAGGGGSPARRSSRSDEHRDARDRARSGRAPRRRRSCAARPPCAADR